MFEPLQLERGLFMEYDKAKDEFKQKLRSRGFVIPTLNLNLNLNMRNSSGVVQMCERCVCRNENWTKRDNTK